MIDTPHSRDARKYVPVGLDWRHPWRQTLLEKDLLNHLSAISRRDPAPVYGQPLLRLLTVRPVSGGVGGHGWPETSVQGGTCSVPLTRG